MILLAQMYFRKHIRKTGGHIDYRLKLFPYSNLFAMIVLLMVAGIMTEMNDMRKSVYVIPIWIFILSMFYVFTKAKVRK